LHHLARVSKDISAAAVLAAAIIAILIGLLILGPPLLDRLIALEFSG
jgi:diacylglycerol kinase